MIIIVRGLVRGWWRGGWLVGWNECLFTMHTYIRAHLPNNKELFMYLEAGVDEREQQRRGGGAEGGGGDGKGAVDKGATLGHAVVVAVVVGVFCYCWG